MLDVIILGLEMRFCTVNLYADTYHDIRGCLPVLGKRDIVLNREKNFIDCQHILYKTKGRKLASDILLVCFSTFLWDKTN